MVQCMHKLAHWYAHTLKEGCYNHDASKLSEQPTRAEKCQRAKSRKKRAETKKQRAERERREFAPPSSGP